MRIFWGEKVLKAKGWLPAATACCYNTLSSEFLVLNAFRKN